MRRLFFLIFYFSSLSLLAFEYPNLSEKAEISIITCGEGAELYSTFGHTAIRVKDDMLSVDRVYNFGLFDFRTENFYLKFIKGDLLYYVNFEEYNNFVYSYQYFDRSVYEQTLKLNREQKNKIWKLLNNSLKESEKYYYYRFLEQNCTTKVVDIVNAVLEQPLKVEVKGNTDTYRKILNFYLSKNYFEKLGINLILGNKIDEIPNNLFLPNIFYNSLVESRFNAQSLVSKTEIIYEKKNEIKGQWWNTIWVFSVLLALWAILMRKSLFKSVFFVSMGVLGIFFIVVQLYSLHPEVLYNNIVLMCNPLMLLLPFLDRQSVFYRRLIILIRFLLLMFLILNILSVKLIVCFPLFLLTAYSLTKSRPKFYSKFSIKSK